MLLLLLDCNHHNDLMVFMLDVIRLRFRERSKLEALGLMFCDVDVLYTSKRERNQPPIISITHAFGFFKLVERLAAFEEHSQQTS